MKSVSIIGPNGQLGSDLVKVFKKAGWRVNPITHAEMSVENAKSVSVALKNAGTDWIINTAAFHKIDECEKDSQRAWEINTNGAMNVALAANEYGMRSVFISSDYVYSGNKGSSYTEVDPVSPVNAYGHSKAGGEAVTIAASSSNLVVRIASVFGSAGSSGKGGNFVETIINKAKAGDSLNVVDDILMSPTYASDAAKKILELVSRDESGIFNASNSGITSWFGFASEILSQTGLKTSLSAAKTNFELSPKRPKNSALDITKVEQFLSKSPAWTDGLREYLLEKGYIK